MFVDFEALGMTLPFRVSFAHAPPHQKLQCSFGILASVAALQTNLLASQTTCILHQLFVI